MNRRGFTIVELLIVIAIMGILLVLGVVNLRGSQANARDSERKIDVETIGLHLESYYLNSPTGRYPSTGLQSEQWLLPSLPDADIKSFTAPGVQDPYSSFTAATNTDQTTAGVLPQPTFDQYVYQPLESNGSNFVLCTTGSQQCCKYNIFYHLETDDTVYVYRSKNQC